MAETNQNLAGGAKLTEVRRALSAKNIYDIGDIDTFLEFLCHFAGC